MLERKFAESLEKFLLHEPRKILLVNGARQIGKSYLIRDVGKKLFKHFVEINLKADQEGDGIFKTVRSKEDFYLQLGAMSGNNLGSKDDTLVFLDEIQSYPHLITMLKFLNEDGKYRYVASGSQLGVALSQTPSVPIGSIAVQQMYPLDFEEFLWAAGITEDVIDILKNAFSTNKTVPEFVHDQIMRRYAQYMAVGGLPEVVAGFMGNRDFSVVLNIQNNLLAGYRRDISKYAGKDKVLVKRVFDSIPAQLAKPDKRFVLADLEHGASRRKYADPTQWLIDAGMAYYAIQTNALSLPLSNVENRRLYKLYLLDNGLLCNMSLPRQHFAILNGDLDLNEGAMTEHFVAAELVKKGYPLHYFDQKSKRG